MYDKNGNYHYGVVNLINAITKEEFDHYCDSFIEMKNFLMKVKKGRNKKVIHCGHSPINKEFTY